MENIFGSFLSFITGFFLLSACFEPFSCLLAPLSSGQKGLHGHPLIDIVAILMWVVKEPIPPLACAHAFFYKKTIWS